MEKVGDYEAEKVRFREFFSGFRTGPRKAYTYAQQVTKIANRELTTLSIELDDLVDFNLENEELVEHIKNNANRYMNLFSDVVGDMLEEYRTRESIIDSLDVYLFHRLDLARRREEPANLPPELLRRFTVSIRPPRLDKPTGVRSLKADKIGKLVSISGTVIRASEVRPLLTCATYSCDACSAETFQPISGPTFVPLSSCASAFCKGNKTGGRLNIQTRGSKFIPFQELKIQEIAGDVPAGHVPRSLTVYCRGDVTRKASAGDHVVVHGVFLPLSKNSAFAQISQGLLTDTFLEAHIVELVRKWDEGEIGGELSEEELHSLAQENFYEKLSASIAPEVYGHEDVKKSLLLQLVGGVERSVGGLKIRGTVNICLMGDPGVAKSQLLSYIDRLAPRSQLTSGRGSSGVGLTASIMKDPVTGLMGLEAGALMLADRGICCIDEFDKMQDQERTALHEVMEQQTISIAKAGILTTLHARTAVLAAANPAYGKFNTSRSIQENINLPAALLSRFDLLWLLVDRPSPSEDLRLAKHVTYVHTNLKEPPSQVQALDMSLMRRYIEAASRKNPAVPAGLSDRLVGAYVELRKEARNSLDTTFTSPRTLLAILRLSTALARLRLADQVIDDDVNEAIRLVERSRDSIRSPASKTIKPASAIQQIHKIIRDMKGDALELKVKGVKDKCLKNGFTLDQIEHCLDEYENMNIWSINTNRTKLTFV